MMAMMMIHDDNEVHDNDNDDVDVGDDVIDDDVL